MRSVNCKPVLQMHMESKIPLITSILHIEFVDLSAMVLFGSMMSTTTIFLSRKNKAMENNRVTSSDAVKIYGCYGFWNGWTRDGLKGRNSFISLFFSPRKFGRHGCQVLWCIWNRMKKSSASR